MQRQKNSPKRQTDQSNNVIQTSSLSRSFSPLPSVWRKRNGNDVTKGASVGRGLKFSCTKLSLLQMMLVIGFCSIYVMTIQSKVFVNEEFFQSIMEMESQKENSNENGTIDSTTNLQEKEFSLNEHAETVTFIETNITLAYSFSDERGSIEIPETMFTVGNLPLDVTYKAIRTLYDDKQLLSKDFVIQILENAKQVLHDLPSVVSVDIPTDTNSTNINNSTKTKERNPRITLVGDIHGQFYGLMHIFDIHGFPTPSTPYVFSGDMSDTGDLSLSLLLSLLMIKLSCPSCVHMTRGNHEVESFLEGRVQHQIIKKYGQDDGYEIYQLFLDTVRELPISILLKGTTCNAFVMHGGITHNDLTIDHIMQIKRGRDPDYDSFFENIIWADPKKKNGLRNGARGVEFGPDVTKSFLRRNDLCLLIRGHTYVPKGYVVEHDQKLVTLYSAPYDGDKGAILKMNSNMSLDFHTYNSSPYPKVGNWSSFLRLDADL